MMTRMIHRRTPPTAIVLLVLAACTDGPVQPTSPYSAPPAVTDRSRAPEPLVDRYIVVFEAGTADPASLSRRLAAEYGGTIHHVYEHALRGFAATLSPEAVQALERNPNVAYVEADGLVRASEVYQPNPTWGIDRVDQRLRPQDGVYVYNSVGSGVNVYVLDTGIASHTDFQGRQSWGYDVFGGNAHDCNGHGTHVAGTVASATFGVAKAAHVVAVRVLDCWGWGTWSGVIAGVDWVTANRIRPAVANMSLGGGANSAADDAVRNSIAAGVTYVVAAGNDNVNACNVSPARVGEALTTGATDAADNRSVWSGGQASNFGSCVDLFAPGTNITSTWLNNSTWTDSGTSMAAPHVAGAAALYLQTNPWASPSTVRSVVLNNATIGVLGSNLGSGSPNRLLYTRWVAPRVWAQGHVGYIGWQQAVADYDFAGTTGQALDLQAVMIWTTLGVDICYQAHVANVGWQAPVCNGTVAGTTGLSLDMQAIRIWLPTPPPGMRVCYQAHVAWVGWQPEVCDGDQAGTTGQSLPMQALRVRIVA
jgi:subtilisin family serine protease